MKCPFEDHSLISNNLKIPHVCHESKSQRNTAAPDNSRSCYKISINAYTNNHINYGHKNYTRPRHLLLHKAAFTMQRAAKIDIQFRILNKCYNMPTFSAEQQTFIG